MTNEHDSAYAIVGGNGEQPENYSASGSPIRWLGSGSRAPVGHLAPSTVDLLLNALHSSTANPYEHGLRWFVPLGVVARAVGTSPQANMPPNFEAISAAIQQSKRIIEWEDNWDSEGSPAYSEATWRRATDLLRRSVLSVWQSSGLIVDVPRIAPGPDGSIDIHWRNGNRKLLINIPTDANGYATFYGEKGPDNTVEGNLNTSSDNQWLLMWLMK